MRIVNFDDGFTSSTAPTITSPATGVSVTPTGNLAADDVQEALVELQGDIDGLNTDVTALQTDKIDLTEKGAVDGVAELDSGGKVPTSQLPDSVLGAVSYQGTWNATTNTPTLSDGSGDKGHYYVVATAGSTNIDGITDWVIGDWIVANDTAWEKIDNTESVVSVAGKVGVVTLDSSDVGLNNVDNTSDATKNAAAATLSSKTLAAPIITTSAMLNAQAEMRFGDSDSSNYIGFKAPATVAANKVFTLPDADGSNGQVLKTNGSLALSWTTVLTAALTTSAKSADYTVTDVDGIQVILMTTAGTDRVVTLPTAADNIGRQITIKKVDSGTGKVTIDGEGAETVDGAADVKLYLQYEAVTLVCDGTSWFIENARWASGTYNPTPSGHVNFTTNGTVQQTHFSRNANIVSVSGVISGLQTTATGTDTSVNLSLPVPTANFADAFQASGTGTLYDNAMIDEAMFVEAVSGAQTVLLKVDTTAQAASTGKSMWFTFFYKIQ